MKHEPTDGMTTGILDIAKVFVFPSDEDKGSPAF